MANFNATLAEAKGEGANAVAPIKPAVGNAPNPWADVAAAGANIFLKLREKSIAEEKQKAHDDITSSFVRANTSINDAVTSGQMTRAEAAVRQRSTFSQFSAQYPGFVKEFGQLGETLTTGTELGEFKEEEQARQTAARKLRQDAIDAGYPIYDGLSPQTEELFITAHQVSVKNNKEFENMAKRKAELRAASAEERTAFDYEAKKTAASNLSKMGKEMMPATMSFISELSTQSSTVEQKKLSMQKLTNHFAFIDGNIASISQFNPELAGNWKGVFDELRKNGMELIDGSLDAKAYKQKEDSLKSRIIVAALESNPKLQGLYAGNHLLGNAFSVNVDVQEGAAAALSYFTQIGGVDGNLPPVVGNPNSEGFVLNTLDRTLSKLANGTSANPEVEKKQAANVLTNYMNQFTSKQVSGASSKELSKAIDFFGSSAFRQAMEQGLVTKEQSTVTMQANMQYFEKTVAPQIDEKFSQPFEGLQSYGDLVEVKWAGANPVVIPLDRRMTPEQAKQREQIIRDLQPSMDALGKVTRAGAHLEGHSDYAKFFETYKGAWMPSMYDESGKKIVVPGREMRGTIKQSVKKEDLVAGKTKVGGYTYLGGNPDNQASWRQD